MWIIESLLNTTSKAPSSNGKGPGETLRTEIRSESPAASIRAAARATSGASTSIPGDVGGAEALDEEEVDRTEPAPDVEHARARDRRSGHDPGHLLRPARGEEPLPPHPFEPGDERVAVLVMAVSVRHSRTASRSFVQRRG